MMIAFCHVHERSGRRGDPDSPSPGWRQTEKHWGAPSDPAGAERREESAGEADAPPYPLIN
ncbi:hypothetical protein [Nonomuraea coxensis]|uniref:hypothetical protein n=1 Tax=Nonomuraea coxensis TaxID=404386 RepID=UPI0012F8F669|nr:hypothetical protein [Nonomuraea coxensis]